MTQLKQFQKSQQHLQQLIARLLQQKPGVAPHHLHSRQATELGRQPSVAQVHRMLQEGLMLQLQPPQEQLQLRWRVRPHPLRDVMWPFALTYEDLAN